MKEPVAVYARVSSRDDRQNVEGQLREIGDYANRKNWQIVAQYIDRESGSKPAAEREALTRMFADARRKKFSRLIVWSLDRLSRQGITKTFQHLQRLKTYDVLFHSYSEPEFSTDGPGAELLIAVTAWIADHERRRLIERINTGLDTARARGAVLGRPSVTIDDAKLSACNTLPVRKAAKLLGVSAATVYRRRKAQPAE